MLLLIRTLTPVRVEKDLALLAGCFIIAYGLTGILVVAFRCALPQTWNSLGNKCLNWV